MGIFDKLADFCFFQITVIADLEFKGNTYKNVTQRNNDGILTPENWEQHKDTFFQQRMETYKDSYTLAEKVKLESQRLEKLPINEEGYQILKDRYSYYLKTLTPQQINTKTETAKYTAKHYLLAYLFECNATGESFPMGNKKELERIGNERIGTGKGNRFYKVFNEIINKDLNAENELIEIGGEDWRKAVVELSKTPELVEKYLQNKQL